MPASSAPSLPPAPDCEQQKSLANELLESYSAGEPQAQKRVRTVLPDKSPIVLADAQFVIAREYGFRNWSAPKRHITAQVRRTRPPEEQIHEAFRQHDAAAVRRLLERQPEIRALLDEPVFPFNAPDIVTYAGDRAVVEVLLDFGADPNRRSEWWAGGFPALYSATDATAELLLAAGAEPDACAAAHLDRPELLASMLWVDPAVAHQWGGDGQSPLHFAKSRAVVDLLISAGADIDARDVDRTARFTATATATMRR